MSENQQDTELAVGRYLLHRQIARGGMATIHIARLMGDVGFSRIVAAKRLHPELAQDAEFVAMFLDEARIASRVHHRNVVPVLDVVTHGDEIVLVQEYVHGAPLSWLQRAAHVAKAPIPVPVACAIACDVLAGLHAAHGTTDEMGVPLHIVHRDVSPQNVLIATDGTARLLDFGIAKVEMAGHVTRKGTFKGKLGYAPAEQIRGKATWQSDIYSLSIVLWELLVGRRLFGSVESEAELIGKIIAGEIPTITEALGADRAWQGNYRWSQLEVLEPIVGKGLARDPAQRWATAAEMAEELAQAVPPASGSDVADWLRAVGKEFLDGRDKMIAAEEASYRRSAIGTQVSSNRIGTVVSQPSSPTKPRHTKRIVAGAVIAGMAIALVAVALLHGSSDPQPTASIAPVAVPLAPSAPATTTPLPQPSEPAPATDATTRPARSDVESHSDGRTRATAAHVAPHPLAKPMSRPAPKPYVIAVPPPPAVAPSPPAAPVVAAPPAPAKPDCSTPYYFEGSKKIFKPDCV